MPFFHRHCTYHQQVVKMVDYVRAGVGDINTCCMIMPTQWPTRDTLMFQDRNCCEAIFVSRQILSRNYPHRGGHFERGTKAWERQHGRHFGALRKGPPCHASRSSREIKLQNASCQMGGREVKGRYKCFFLRKYEWSRSYREMNQHPSLPWNFITHGFLDASAFPEFSETI